MRKVAEKENTPLEGVAPSPEEQDTEDKKYQPTSELEGISTVETGSNITDEELIELQAIRSSETPYVEHESPSTTSYGLSPRHTPSARSVTGLPSSASGSVEDLVDEVDRTITVEAPEIHAKDSEQSSPEGSAFGEEQSEKTNKEGDAMGQTQTKKTSRTIPKNIMNEEPQEFLQRSRVVETEVTGNCRPWSDHVYYKLFLDTEGRLATLMVVKCEITYVDVFTDVEHVLYRSRFIGGKEDGVTQLFVFDLMKEAWEEKIPQSQAIELNVDIVMSSSPVYSCAETLLNLVKLEKAYLKHRSFDGQLNVTIRFAHALAWDARDHTIRGRIHEGLRNLYREGINLEVMNADVILDEMRVDDISITDEERIRYHISARNAWTIPPMRFKTFHQKEEEELKSQADEDEATCSSRDLADRQSLASLGMTSHSSLRDSIAAEKSMSTMDDGYYVYLHTSLWTILRGTRRSHSILEETVDG